MNSIKVALSVAVTALTICLPSAFARNAGMRITAAPEDGVPVYTALSPSGKSCAHKCGKKSPSDLENRFLFYLPKQVADLTVTYTVYKDPTDPDKGPCRVQIEQPAKLSLVAFPDKKLGFIADYTKIRGFLTDVAQNDLSISATGCFTGMNAEYKDQTAASIGEIVGSAVKIAKAAATGALGAGGAIKPVYTFDVHRVIRIDSDVPHQDNSSEANNYASLPTDDIKKKGVHFALNQLYHIDDEVRYVLENQDLKPPNYPGDYPALSIWLDKDLTSASSTQLIDGAYAGVVVREPNITDIVVYSKQGLHTSRFDKVLAETVTRVAQTGSFRYIPMDRHFFTDFNVKVTHGDAGVTDINQTSTSILKTIADAIKAATDAL